MATRSLKEQAGQNDEAISAAVIAKIEAPAVIKSTAPTEERAPSQIVTTEEELEALAIIQAICADSPVNASAPIIFKDTTSWFTISAISIRRWFVRLCFNQRKKSIFTKIPPEQAKALSPGFEVDRGWVYINSVKDLYRLRPLILLAYEEAARQSEPAAEVEMA